MEAATGEAELQTRRRLRAPNRRRRFAEVPRFRVPREAPVRLHESRGDSPCRLCPSRISTGDLTGPVPRASFIHGVRHRLGTPEFITADSVIRYLFDRLASVILQVEMS